MTFSPRRAAPLAAGLATALAACATPAPSPAPSDGPASPSLVVLVVVDQLRGDMLDIYQEAFTGGFRRLREEGHRFTAASHNHAVTETAPGHATLATGVAPSRHGIVANDFRVPTDNGFQLVYAVEDTTRPLIGLPAFDGRSPENLRRPGLGDWILEADSRARVVAASKKDRAAVTIGGRSPDAHVYWIADGAGRFVTSTYYEDELPDWVQDFNEGPMARLYADSVWESTVPDRFRALAGPDSADWEGDAVHTTFPHLAAEEAEEGPIGRNLWVDRTPVPDEAVLRFGLTALDELELGQRGTTDLLALSFSQTDYVGHDYGPVSQEQLDNLFRLDRVLDELFRTLDREVGEGRWVLALSADHGVLTTPEQRELQGEFGYRVTRDDLQALVAVVRDALREGGGEEAARERVVERVEALPHIARVYRHDELERLAPTDTVAALFQRSLHPDRHPGLLSHLGFEIVWEEGVLSSVMARGTSHLGPWWFDRWVPLAFLGAGVESGVSDADVYTWDVAPTLARLARIEAPRDLDGRALLP